MRGSRVGFVIDPFRRRQIRFESGLEEFWITVLVARRNVTEVREQQLVHYRVGRRTRKHVFDFIVTWSDGTRTAYAVKYAQDVTSELEAELIAVNDTHGNTIADSYEILTEEMLDEISIYNAQLTISCCLDYDEEGRDILLNRLSECPSEFRLGEVGELSGLGNRGYRAAITLLRDRVLYAPHGELLGPRLIVENRASRYS